MADETKKDTDIIAEDTINISPEIEKQVIQQWETIGICNDFVFCKVMQDEELLTELIHLILPHLKFHKLNVEAQRTIEIGMDIRGVKLCCRKIF